MNYITTLLLISGLSSNTFAADIYFSNLASKEGHNNAISGECVQLKNSQNMECTTRQISFRYKLDPQKLEEKYKEIEVEFDQELEGTTPTKWIKENMSFCSKLEDKTLDTNRLDPAIINVCKQQTKESLINFMKTVTNQEVETCLVYERETGTYLFEKVNATKWVSNNGPRGECGSVILLSLEQKSLKYPYLWTFTQQRTYTNIESQLCKDLSEINETITYSWKALKRRDANCKYIEFGMY